MNYITNNDSFSCTRRTRERQKHKICSTRAAKNQNEIYALYSLTKMQKIKKRTKQTFLEIV